MPLSAKKLAALRRNALRSTGPKTPEGKKKSSRNAIRHGFFARDLIVNCPYLNESPADYDRYDSVITSHLCPNSQAQELLAKKLTFSVWRQQRLITAFLSHIEARVHILSEKLPRNSPLKKTFKEADLPFNLSSLPPRLLCRHLSHIGRISLSDDPLSRRLLKYQKSLAREISRLLDLYYTLKKDEDRDR
ncbi:MAG: hypothetical protein AB1690_02715 [Candidatus Zixiibacteriota bacterium]|jgi:hypothetical protein